MPNSLPPGQPTATKTVTQLTDNLGLFLFSHFAGYLLSPVFWFYPLSMAYVHGKYPSIKDFKALVFTNRFIKCSLVGWLLSLIPILGFASLPFYSHYVFTKDDEPFDLIRESMSESLEDPSFIIKSTIAAIVSCFGIFLCFVGQIITIPLACIFIYGEMLNITEKLITPLKKRLHKKTVKETIEETSNETSKEPSQSPFSNRKDRVDILMKTKDAINNDNLSQLRLLITRDGLDPNYTILPGEWTLLHKSIEDGKVEIAKLLIDSGANIYAKGGWSKRTPLGLIIQQNNSFLMEYLISKGNFNSEKGKWATGYCKWKIIKALNNFNEVCGLIASSKTISSSNKISLPYEDLKAAIMFDNKDLWIRFNNDPNIVDQEVRESGFYHNLSIRIDGKDFKWEGKEGSQSSNDIILNYEEHLQLLINGKILSISLPLYQQGHAIFTWKINGIAESLLEIFSYNNEKTG